MHCYAIADNSNAKMIQFIQIKNLVLMDSVQLEWGTGFTAVTGETGAGKSILLGALALLSGARAEKSWIRQGEETCEVEAVLQVSNCAAVHVKLAELELPPCEEGALLITRTLSRSKAPRILINGRLTTLANLQALSLCWIDFHGPGEPQKLFQESLQLELLDLFGKHQGLLRSYGGYYEEFTRLEQELTRLRASEQLSPDEKEFITRQIAAIDEVKPSEAGIAELERNYNRMSHAQELADQANALNEALAGDDGIADRMGGLLPAARALGTIDPDLQPLAERMESVIIELNDLAESYSDAAQQADLDPREVDQLEQQMNRWMELKRKYGGDPAVILARRSALQQKLDAQGDIAGSVAKLEKSLQGLTTQLRIAGQALLTARQKAAAQLEQLAATRINDLGFRKARFGIKVTEEPGFQARGNSSCQFQFAPNAGQPLMPLNKIASSGELARVMLALKTVLAEVDATPVLVFDEVDANVGGEIAVVVAREMAKLARKHQVFCVTHLPQVAAAADHHFVVRKTMDDESTSVQIQRLQTEGEPRLLELARMLGDRDSPSAKAHAKELLRNPQF